MFHKPTAISQKSTCEEVIFLCFTHCHTRLHSSINAKTRAGLLCAVDDEITMGVCFIVQTHVCVCVYVDRYRWAFIGDPTSSSEIENGRRFKDQVPFFTPHIIRIAKLMNARVSQGSAVIHFQRLCLGFILLMRCLVIN